MSPRAEVDSREKATALWAVSPTAEGESRGKPRSEESPSVAEEVRGILRPRVSLMVAVDALPRVAALWDASPRVAVEPSFSTRVTESASVAEDVR